MSLLTYDEQQRKIFDRATVKQTGVRKSYELISKYEIDYTAMNGTRAVKIMAQPEVFPLSTVYSFTDKGNAGGLFRTHVYIAPNKQLKKEQIEIGDYQQRSPKGEPVREDKDAKIRFRKGQIIQPNWILTAFLDDHPLNEANKDLYGYEPVFRELKPKRTVDEKELYSTKRNAMKMLNTYLDTNEEEDARALLYHLVSNNSLKSFSSTISIDAMDAGNIEVGLMKICDENPPAIVQAINAMRGTLTARGIQLWLQNAMRASTIEGAKGAGLAIGWSKRVQNSISDARINKDPLYPPYGSTDEFLESLTKRGASPELITFLRSKFVNGLATYVALYDKIRQKNDEDGSLAKLIATTKEFNANFGISNPHPDEKDIARRFDTQVLPILEELENNMNYENGNK